MDEPTADLSRPSLSRVYVELDLTAPRMPTLYLEIDDSTIRQPVMYENCPPYCSFLKHLGHDHTACLNKNKAAQSNPNAGTDETTSNKEKKVAFQPTTNDKDLQEDGNRVAQNKNYEKQGVLEKDEIIIRLCTNC
ncbi:UNVERIFIED_CONTAM: hypothetical protein Sradi_2347000 [Sesamum radiatum]|uniref:Zinc knuckle CX2CX4HX4C domain-containing protein n=1 Tax=Sesamum radiatum TaxID=300843 RepID=A0AAW2T5Y2_SESRA